MAKKKESADATGFAIDASFLAGVLKPIVLMDTEEVTLGVGDNTLVLEAETMTGKRFRRSFIIQTFGENTKLAVPVKVLMKTLQSLKDDVTISFTSEKVILSQGDKRSFSLPALSPVTLPEVTISDKAFVIRASLLREALTKALRFPSQEVFRENLSGIEITVSRGEVRFIATDGVILSVQKYRVPIDVEEEIKVLLLTDIVKVLDAIETLEFTVDVYANRVLFGFAGGGVFESTVIETKFPDISGIMDNARSVTTHAVLGRTELDMWIRLTNVFTTAGRKPSMVLYVDSDKVMAYTVDPEMASEALSWKAETNGGLADAYMLKLDAERLETIIRALDDQTFTVSLGNFAKVDSIDAGGAMLWRDVTTKDGVSHDIIFMPVRMDPSERKQLQELFQSKEVYDVAAIED